ncbi:MAG: enoyl-CoA hydratase-related protein, partial [Pseudomonadota bacterium]
MTDLVRTEQEVGVLTLTLARADKKNALTHAMYAALADAMDAAETDPAVRAVVFAAEGDAFTAGNDMGDFLGAPPDLAGHDLPPVGRFLNALAVAETPLIAAVNGAAIGVGTTMLFHCDYVVASTKAAFQTPFANLALVPEAGSSLILPQIAGRQAASELLLLGRKISPDRAHDMGFVNEIVEPGALLGTATAAARDLATRAPEAIRLTKRLMKGDLEPLLKRIKEEGALFAQRLGSDEFKEAATA